MPGVSGKFGLGVQNEARQRLVEFCQENSKHHLPTKEEKTIHGHHQMFNTKIRLIIFFAAEDGDALYISAKRKKKQKQQQQQNRS